MEFTRASIPGVVDTKGETFRVPLRLTGEVDLEGVVLDPRAIAFISDMGDMEFMRLLMEELESYDE